jgi:hypothetical protein
MKLISNEHGQSFQQFVMDEIRPASGLYLPDLVRGIAERYAFSVVPTNYEILLKEGAKYKGGRLVTEGRTIEIRDLGFFNDGALAVAWNTEDSELVLNDILTWATQNFGLREPLTKPPRRFTSSVVVEFGAELDRAMAAFDGLKKDLSSAIGKIYGWDVDIETSRVALAADPSKLPPLTTVDFTIERRAGRPFSENRYFSVATVTTDSHLSLLEAFERRLLAKGN